MRAQKWMETMEETLGTRDFSYQLKQKYPNEKRNITINLIVTELNKKVMISEKGPNTP